MAIYGIRELNLLFFVALETNAEGFIFKRKQYTWADIKYVDVGEEGPYGRQSPYCQVTLTDGVSIRFGGTTFEKRGEPLMKGYSSAFNELAALFRMRLKDSQPRGRSRMSASRMLRAPKKILAGVGAPHADFRGGSIPEADYDEYDDCEACS